MKSDLMLLTDKIHQKVLDYIKKNGITRIVIVDEEGVEDDIDYKSLSYHDPDEENRK